MAYTPTDRDRWAAQQAAIKEQRRRIEADRKEAQRIRAQMAKDELAHRKNLAKMQQDAVDQIESEATAEEKALLTKPAIKRTGGTADSAESIIVWHHLAEPPADMTVKQRRRGLGAILILPKGGGYTASDAAITYLRNPGLDVQHPEFIAAHKIALAEMRGYNIVSKLADDKAMGKVFYAAGVTTDTTKDETVAGEYGVYTKKVTRRHVPELKEVVIRASGLELVYRHHLGDSAAQWNKSDKKEALRAAFRSLGVDAGNMEITDTKSGDVKISFNDKDPFGDAKIASGEYDTEHGRSLLGITSDGHPAWITWAGSSGMVVGGVPGSGKTASMLPVFAGMKSKAELHVFDGKSGFDLHPLRHIAKTYDRSGDIDAPLATLRELEALRSRRAEAMHRILQANNFWNIPAKIRERHDLFPVFVVLDEVQTWLDTSGMDKEEKAVSASITKLIRTLIQKGRSAGIVVVLTTQKPDATSVPTVIRDNAALKLCFRVSTPEQAITVLGRQSPNEPDPTRIPMSAKGRAVMETEGHGIVLLQSGYTAPDALDAALADAEPVPSQVEIAREMLGDTGYVTPTDRPRFETAVDTSSPVVKTQVETAPAAGGPVVTEVKTPSTDPAPEPLSDDLLLAALAEAQRRGMISPPAPETAPAPNTDGFDF